jgi:hypothetical protein
MESGQEFSSVGRTHQLFEIPAGQVDFFQHPIPTGRYAIDHRRGAEDRRVWIRDVLAFDSDTAYRVAIDWLARFAVDCIPACRARRADDASPLVELYVIPDGQFATNGRPITADVYAIDSEQSMMRPGEVVIHRVADGQSEDMFIVGRAWLEQFARPFTQADHTLPESGYCFFGFNLMEEEAEKFMEVLLFAAACRPGGGRREHDLMAIVDEYRERHV